MNRFIRLADYTGITASILCIVHCIATPFLLMAFPLIGLAHEDASFHHAMALFVTIPVIAALVPGFVIHQRWSTLALGGLGLACLLVAVFLLGPRFGELAETILAVIGGAFLLMAHFRNRLLCKRCSPQDCRAFCSDDKCNYVARGASMAIEPGQFSGLALMFLLGLRHAVDPDHVAIIDRRCSGSKRGSINPLMRWLRSTTASA